MNNVKYPDIQVPLTGGSGDSFAIMAAVTRAMRVAKVGKDERDAYLAEAKAGDYDNLLQVTMRWVDVV